MISTTPKYSLAVLFIIVGVNLFFSIHQDALFADKKFKNAISSGVNNVVVTQGFTKDITTDPVSYTHLTLPTNREV